MHRSSPKKVKLKEVFRLGGLICHFNKGEGGWTSRDDNCGPGPGKYVGELMEGIG